MVPTPARRGTVTGFGADGWGTVADADGTEYPFHSTAIVDGSRSIQIGTAVGFSLTPGRGGRWEAAAVTPSRA